MSIAVACTVITLILNDQMYRVSGQFVCLGRDFLECDFVFSWKNYVMMDIQAMASLSSTDLRALAGEEIGSDC